ncbi:MAG: helicase-associated domain-containing protein, partial [Anaerolineales bacterium]
TGPLHWLGVLDLAAPAPDATPTAFRFSRWGEALLAGAPPEAMDGEDENFLISSDARIRVPRLVPRSARYQLARFSEWESENPQAYLYRLTPPSLERARDQGLRVVHLLTLLRRYALAVPPSLVSALERWQEHGTQARLDRVTVLRLKDPELLQMLRGSRAARFLGEPLGPTAVIVHEGAWEKVLAVLAEMGYLGETTLETNMPEQSGL